MKNYYEILGVEQNATPQQIKSAYKKLAKKWHPDLNRDNLSQAEEMMKAINVAYNILSDEVARSDYDKTLAKKSADEPKKSKPQQKPNQKSASTAKNINLSNLNNSFSSFFGFDPKTQEITNEDKLNTFTKKPKKNPLDTTDFFERFMGFKK